MTSHATSRFSFSHSQGLEHAKPIVLGDKPKPSRASSRSLLEKENGHSHSSRSKPVFHKHYDTEKMVAPYAPVSIAMMCGVGTILSIVLGACLLSLWDDTIDERERTEHSIRFTIACAIQFGTYMLAAYLSIYSGTASFLSTALFFVITPYFPHNQRIYRFVCSTINLMIQWRIMELSRWRETKMKDWSFWWRTSFLVYFIDVRECTPIPTIQALHQQNHTQQQQQSSQDNGKLHDKNGNLTQRKKGTDTSTSTSPSTSPRITSRDVYMEIARISGMGYLRMHIHVAFVVIAVYAYRYISEMIPSHPHVDEWMMIVTKTSVSQMIGVVTSHSFFISLILYPIRWLTCFIILYQSLESLNHLYTMLFGLMGMKIVPVHHHPMGADYLSEFWGGRWNRVTHELLHGHFYSPLARMGWKRTGRYIAFTLSALLHVYPFYMSGISVPLCICTGLFFIAQAICLMIEATIRPQRGWKSKTLTYVMLVITAPLIVEPFISM